MHLYILCALTALLGVPSQCADILVVLPFPGYSHTMPFMPILKELGRRGHNLTVISAFKQDPNPKGFTQIDVGITMDSFEGYSHTMPFMPILKELGRRGHNLTVISAFKEDPNPKGFTQIDVNIAKKEMMDFMEPYMGKMNLESLKLARGTAFQVIGITFMCNILTPFLAEKTKAVLPPRGTHFDLVITEPFFCTEPLLAASSMYNAPVVATLPLPLSAYIASVMGNPLASSFVPSVRVAFTDDMCFLERVWNTILNVFDIILNKLYFIPAQDKVMRNILGHQDLPYLGDLMQNISFILTETHFSLSYPRPYMKNVLEVGGISVQLAKPLPKDLDTFMNEAKDGVIYFSWGSHFEANDAQKIVDVLLKSFSKVKQKVIFKWHSELPNAPSNVLVKKWVPQPSVLAHKNTVLFISHGGLNSVYEAAFYGVPVLGTPMFGDQPYNIRILEKLGMAKSVNLYDLEDGISFPAALQAALSDPSLMENAKKESRILQDRPISVVDEAAYWIEYIIKHGASHLQPRTREMPWYTIALLDVGIFIVAVVAVSISLLYFLVCVCLRLCRRKPQKPPSKKKKNQ